MFICSLEIYLLCFQKELHLAVQKYCNTAKNLGRGKLALIIMEHVNTFQLKQVLLFKTMLMFVFWGFFFVYYFIWGAGTVVLGWIFLLILYNLKARKTGCSLLHISHLCERNGKFYHAFHSHFVQVTVTGTQCGGQQRTGQNTFILNLTFS